MYDINNYIPKNISEATQCGKIKLTSITTPEKHDYEIVSYNRRELLGHEYSTLGECRSLIFYNNELMCFSPTKSVDLHEVQNSKNAQYEEFIEGTMINLFYNKYIDKWEISTRNTVGANTKFYDKTARKFSEMFEEIRLDIGMVYDKLCKNYCYSFVMQHKENRIVCNLESNKLYLVGVYNICSSVVNEINYRDGVIADMFVDIGINLPELYDVGIVDDLKNHKFNYNMKGVVIRDTLTGKHTKIRNPVYEDVKKLRGNQPKLQYQYLSLRNAGRVSDYIHFYPEDIEEITKYRDQLHQFTAAIYKNYVECFIKKKKRLKEYPFQYKVHMYSLHQDYIHRLRIENKHITMTRVINYINTLEVQQQMYFINYNMNRNLVDQAN
jgi:hypothetical protein